MPQALGFEVITAEPVAVILVRGLVMVVRLRVATGLIVLMARLGCSTGGGVRGRGLRLLGSRGLRLLCGGGRGGSVGVAAAADPAADGVGSQHAAGNTCRGGHGALQEAAASGLRRRRGGRSRLRSGRLGAGP